MQHFPLRPNCANWQKFMRKDLRWTENKTRFVSRRLVSFSFLFFFFLPSSGQPVTDPLVPERLWPSSFGTTELRQPRLSRRESCKLFSSPDFLSLSRILLETQRPLLEEVNSCSAVSETCRWGFNYTATSRPSPFPELDSCTERRMTQMSITFVSVQKANAWEPCYLLTIVEQNRKISGRDVSLTTAINQCPPTVPRAHTAYWEFYLITS